MPGLSKARRAGERVDDAPMLASGSSGATIAGRRGLLHGFDAHFYRGFFKEKQARVCPTLQRRADMAGRLIWSGEQLERLRAEIRAAKAADSAADFWGRRSNPVS